MNPNEGLQKRNHHLSVLLAEDDDDDREIMRDAFFEVDPSFKLTIVPDGKSVLSLLEQTPDDQLPCLIVLDYNMPELTGPEVLQYLYSNNRYQQIPKVIFSTSSNSRYIEEAIRNGAHAYRVKPSNYYTLLEMVKEMIYLCSPAA
jgi:CheY-like chemotaxis protein